MSIKTMFSMSWPYLRIVFSSPIDKLSDAFERIKALPAGRIKEERIRVPDWEKFYIYVKLLLRK